ncbi:MAG: leucine-rich repeat domain-containing protein, partial [Ruminococcus sp.]|nr:leucine-rich repeat domain-containing protein [Ruminococcus sp.]
LTSATIAFTALGGVFSDVLSKINLLSLPIVAEAVNESTAVTLNDNTYADSSAQGIKIESAEVPLGTEEVTLGVSLMNISKSVGCVVTAKCPVELGEPRISGEIAGKDIYIKNEDYLVQALCINCDGLSSEFLFITFDIPQDTVTCTTYDIDIEVEQLDNDGSFIDNPVAIDGTIEIYEPINIITQPIEEATDEPEVTTVIDNSNSGIKLESKDVPLGIKEVTLAVSLINISNSIGCIVTAKSPLVLGEPKISGAIKIKNVSVTEEQYSSSALCIATTGLSSEFMYITFNIPVNALPGTVYDIYVEVEQLDNNGFLLENAITVDGKITIVNEFKGLEYQTIDTDNNGTHDAVEIYDCNSNVASIEIPAEINGLPVKRIAERAFYACSDLEKIIIPEGLVVIDDDAFRDCTSLTSVNIPSTVTTINRGAFFGCNKLKSITIPETVTYISSFWKSLNTKPCKW